MTYLLDTNSLIYYFQGAPQMDPVFRQIEQGDARPLVSIITVIELLGYPRLTRQDETRIQSLLSGFTVVAVDERIAGQAVLLKRRHGVKTPDAIIADMVAAATMKSRRWVGAGSPRRGTSRARAWLSAPRLDSARLAGILAS